MRTFHFYAAIAIVAYYMVGRMIVSKVVFDWCLIMSQCDFFILGIIRKMIDVKQ